MSNLDKIYALQKEIHSKGICSIQCYNTLQLIYKSSSCFDATIFCEGNPDEHKFSIKIEPFNKEKETKEYMFETYEELSQILENARKEYGI